jgi:hypothetical protein
MPYQFSDALDDQLLYERIESFGGGMDAWQRATLLPGDVYQYAENVVVQDNHVVRTRPGADTLEAAPATGEAGGPHKIQGLFYYDTPAIEQLIAGSAGKLWTWEGEEWTEVTGYSLTDAALRVEMEQGVDLVLISDGTAQMRTWNGIAISAALGNTTGTVTSDPPVGATILAWHAGRMFASGKATESDTIYASYLLEFVTGKWDHVNFKFRVGAGEGDPIRAMVSMQDFVLAVLKESSVWLVLSHPGSITPTGAGSAAAWEIRKVAGGLGCVGKRAWARWGNDVLFMSQDGVRSLGRMQAAAGQYDVSPPISQPLQPYVNRINWAVSHLIEARAYKDLVLFAVPLDSATTNDHVLVYNARLARWVGIWTGWTPATWEVTRFAGVQRLVTGEQSGLVRQWKDYADSTDSDTYLEDGAPIATKVWTRSMLFAEPVNDKDGYHAEGRFSVSDAIVNFTAVADNADLRSWSKDLRQPGVTLPVDLPFDLHNPAAVTARRGLRGATPFNEIFLKIESTSGWWELRNVTLSAYLNMLQNQ